MIIYNYGKESAYNTVQRDILAVLSFDSIMIKNKKIKTPISLSKTLSQYPTLYPIYVFITLSIYSVRYLHNNPAL